MLGRLFRSANARPATRRGERIYAIGDVHGHLDLLDLLLDRIDQHAAAMPPAPAERIVFIGDLVDRGPQSAQVLSAVHALTRERDVTVLRGNHEDMMLRALAGEPGLMRIWLRTGGRDTLRSYGMEPPPRGSTYDEFELARELRERVTPTILDWLKSLPLSYQSGDYYFCHAGVRPGVPLKQQKALDLMWIREDFIGVTDSHGAVVVHGHTISEQVEQLPNRIGIDTGAYESGVLSALYVEDTARAVLTAS